MNITENIRDTQKIVKNWVYNNRITYLLVAYYSRLFNMVQTNAKI